MNGCMNFKALAHTVKISDITSDVGNADILCRLMNNDPSFTRLRLYKDTRTDDADDVYCPEGAHDMELLGYYVGKNSRLRSLLIYRAEDFIGSIEPFCRGVKNNTSIRRLELICSNLSGFDIFEPLAPFIKENPNLTNVEVEECQIGPEGCRSLPPALAERKKNSFERFALCCCEIDDGSLRSVVSSLGTHHQLETLELSETGRTGSAALACLPQRAFSRLRILRLRNSALDDERVAHLLGALGGNQKLQELDLSNNPSISIRGWRAVSKTLLEATDSTLRRLSVQSNEINDGTAIVFASALSNNRTLEELQLYNNLSITSEGWGGFEQLLCDTSSVERIHLSNHTLKRLDGCLQFPLPSHLKSLLKLNHINNKNHVAIVKILKHRELDMLPLFLWDLKALPFVITWFEKASYCPFDFHANIETRKLSAIFQFVRDFSALCNQKQGVCPRHSNFNMEKSKLLEIVKCVSSLGYERWM